MSKYGKVIVLASACLIFHFSGIYILEILSTVIFVALAVMTYEDAKKNNRPLDLGEKFIIFGAILDVIATIL